MPTAAVMGGIAIYGAVQSHRAAKKKEEQEKAAQDAAANSTSQQAGLSTALQGYANKQFKMAEPALSQGMSYYSKLLGGDRGTVQGAIAPDVANINQAYEGTQKYLDQQGVRGGARDNAIAENERQRVGQVGMLPFLARKGAADASINAGTNLTGQATAAQGSAAGAASGSGATALGQSGQLFNQEQVRGNQIADTGANLASLYANWASGRGKTPKTNAGTGSSFDVM